MTIWARCYVVFWQNQRSWNLSARASCYSALVSVVMRVRNNFSLSSGRRLGSSKSLWVGEASSVRTGALGGYCDPFPNYCLEGDDIIRRFALISSGLPSWRNTVSLRLASSKNISLSSSCIFASRSRLSTVSWILRSRMLSYFHLIIKAMLPMTHPYSSAART